MDINSIKGWKKDRWRCSDGGSDAYFLAKNENDNNINVFIEETMPNEWKVKVGKGKDIGQYEYALKGRKSFKNKEIAEIKAMEFMTKNPKLIWRGPESYPSVSKPNGDRINKVE